MFRVVVISGPRQAGKTTLLELVPEIGPARVISLDRPDLLARATDDPVGFVSEFDIPVAVDEFQRAGNDLLLAVKYLVDRRSERGQFVLAGSTNFLANQRLADTLPGRVGLVDLLPLSHGEIVDVQEDFIDRAFTDPEALAEIARSGERLARDQLTGLVATGGYPEVVSLGEDADRVEFFRAYLDTVTGRESLADIGAARTRSELRRVIELVASRTACEYHPTALANATDLTRQTIASYIEMLRALHLVLLLPAWATSATVRARRAPKLHLVDSGLATVAAGSSESDLRRPDSRNFGSLLETFVATELVKASAWAHIAVDIMHFRDREGREVDLVLQADDGRVVALEVKASDRTGPRAFEHLRYLRDQVGDRFVGGYVLSGGGDVWKHSDRLWAVPVSTLWTRP